MVSIKDATVPQTHSSLNRELPIGGFSCNLSSATGGAAATDTLTIIHDRMGILVSVTASEVSIPAGATLAVLRPLIMNLLN